jgi:hypothetical protein
VPTSAQAVTRRSRVVVALVLGGLIVLLLGPALAPGYTLIRDQVFVPDQNLLPWMLGIGAGLPRSVPQDAVVAVLSGPVPGWLLEKLAMVAALALLGGGVARLLRASGTGARVVGVVAGVWSAYVVERLLMGHWSLLLAVGTLPWLLDLARRARSGERRTWARWFLLLSLASLTVSGGLLALAVSLPVAIGPGSRMSRARRISWTVTGLVAQLPWLVPTLVVSSSVTGVGAAGSQVFRLRAESWAGALVTALGTGGVWNADAVPGTRTTVLPLLATLVLLGLAAAGAGRVVRVLGRAATLTLGTLAVLGLLWSVAGTMDVLDPVVTWVVGSVPGGGVLRDAHKWLAPWLLLVAVAAGLGADRLACSLARRSDRTAARTLLVGLALVPLVCLPDAAWGVSGQLASVAYPDDYAVVRDRLAASGPGDAISLPWQTFRRFPWNDGRTVLDPVPRFMSRSVVASDSLVVRSHGELVTVSGEDPRAAEITRTIAAGRPLGPVLVGLGIGWAVVATDAPDATSTLPDGAVLVTSGDHLALYRLAAAETQPRPDGLVLVLVADATAIGVLVFALVLLVRQRGARGRSGRNAGQAATGW